MGALRRIAASYWTALALGVAAIVLHIRWYTVDKAPGPEVVSGFGAALVVLGVFVGSRPYVRAGFNAMVEAALPQDDAGYLVGPNYLRELKAMQDAARPQARRDVLAERVIAVAVVIVGTLLNGYGPLFARLLGLRLT